MLDIETTVVHFHFFIIVRLFCCSFRINLTQFWKQTRDNKLYRAYDQVSVDIWISKQVERSFNILPRQVSFLSTEVSTSDDIWDRFNYRVGALALDFCGFCGCRLYSRGSE